MAERVVKVRLVAQVSDYEKGMLAAASATRTLGTETEKLEQKRQAFEQVGRGLVLTGAALTAVTALSVKAAIEWESAWAGVTKTVDGNAEQMGELEDGLRSLATTLPATHQEIAAVAEAAGQLGVSREGVVAFTKTMVDLSETTNLTADEAATSIAQLMNVMQTAPDEVDNLGSALVALGNDGASTERDIIQMAQRIAGAGRTVGLTEAQVLGFANALASVGIEAEAGGSAISRIMTDIAMSVSSGGEKLDEFAKVAGMSSSDFQKAFKEAPADAIATFVEGLGRIDATGGDVFKTLSDLGQSDIRVSQALLGMANSGDLLRESLELGSAAWDENTALAVEAAKRYETTEAKIQIAGNAIRDAAIDFGEVFLPAVAAASDGIAEFASFMGDLPDPVQGVVGVLSSVVGLVALTGGAALLAVPKWAAFKVAVDNLGWSMKSIGIVGGGAIIALTALITVVGAVSAAQAKAEERARSYSDTLAEGTHKVTKATQELIAENIAAKGDGFLWLDDPSMAQNAKDLGLSLDTVRAAIEGDAEAIDELNAKTKTAIDGYSFWDSESIKLKSSAEQLQDAVEGEIGSLDRAAEMAREKAEATRDSADSADSATEAYRTEAEAVGELNDELAALIDQINESNGVAQDAITANSNYQSALAGISEEVQRQRDAYEEVNGTLDGFILSLDQNTESGSANAAMLSDVAGKAQDAAAAQFEQDKATMSSKDAADKYYSTLQNQRQAFIDSAVAAGYNADEVQVLADKVFALPSEKAIQVLAQTDTASEKLRVLKERLDAIPENKYTRITLETLNIGGKTISAQANGGFYQRGQYAGSGFEPGIYPYTPGGIDKFAEQWSEAYISLDPARHQRSESVWVKTGQELGMFSGGGGQAGQQMSLNGLSITGTLEIGGDGLGRIIDGHISAKDIADNTWSRGGVREP